MCTGDRHIGGKQPAGQHAVAGQYLAQGRKHGSSLSTGSGDGETGLGDIQGNEGVYGFQRAFKIAGAKYLIMSLWQVPDQQTSLLMTTFYKKWLEEKTPIPEALQAAQQALREAGLDPFNWAGFVLVE